MTRLGIKTNIMAMLVCIVSLVSGYIGALLIAGYILLMENDQMLRKTAIKALTIMCIASLLTELIGLLPETISWVSSLLSLFNGSLYIGFLSNLCNVLAGAVWLVEAFLLLVMAFKAYKGSEFSVKQLDAIVANAEGNTHVFTTSAKSPVNNGFNVGDNTGCSFGEDDGVSDNYNGDENIDVFG